MLSSLVMESPLLYPGGAGRRPQPSLDFLKGRSGASHGRGQDEAPVLWTIAPAARVLYIGPLIVKGPSPHTGGHRCQQPPYIRPPAAPAGGAAPAPSWR